MYPWLKRILRSSLFAGEKRLKHAGAHKIDLLTKNALSVLGERQRVGVLGTHFGRGLHNFAESGENRKMSGGFIWTWTRLLDGRHLRDYGIWFSSRLISSNIAQYCVCIYVLVAGIYLTRNVIENYDEEEAKATISRYTAFVVDTAVDEGVIDAVMVNVTSLIGSFVGDIIDQDGFNCSGSDELSGLESACYFASDKEATYSCDPDADINYLCMFAKIEAHDEQQMAVLQASGFDTNKLESVLRASLDAVGDSYVESLYPSADYM
jgi:hypothetical protein